MTLTEAQTDDALRYLRPLCKTIAYHYEGAVMGMRYGDLFTDALTAAWQAILVYDASLHTSLWHWAGQRIRWALVDAIRVELGRNGHRNGRLHNTSLSELQDVGWDIEHIEDGYQVVDQKMEVESLLYGFAGVAWESERFADILRATYINDVTLKQYGEWIGVTESRVCQLRNDALRVARHIAKEAMAFS